AFFSRDEIHGNVCPLCFVTYKLELLFLPCQLIVKPNLITHVQLANCERLLLSVLPEHVAVKMRQDWGSAKDSQFKKIYMSRHENVRILPFATACFCATDS
ncbi:hypothetical protein L9F63_001569, partial [Diploptera punctata]